MGYRHPNPRLVKVHRNYSVEEIARLFGIHKNTVRNWLKQGLTAIDDRRPTLILGQELSRFLTHVAGIVAPLPENVVSLPRKRRRK